MIEQGGSSVKSAAFPLDVSGDVVKDDEGVKKPPKTDDEKRGLKSVVLALDGKAHELAVGYMRSHPGVAAVLPARRAQGWAGRPAGMGDDGRTFSGEDWKDVKLALVAGAPLSFEAQLGTAVIPPRPTVTDMGEVIAAVPRAETSLSQEAPPPPSPAPAAAPPEAAAGAGGRRGAERAGGRRASQERREGSGRRERAHEVGDQHGRGIPSDDGAGRSQGDGSPCPPSNLRSRATSARSRPWRSRQVAAGCDFPSRAPSPTRAPRW